MCDLYINRRIRLGALAEYIGITLTELPLSDSSTRSAEAWRVCRRINRFHRFQIVLLPNLSRHLELFAMEAEIILSTQHFVANRQLGLGVVVRMPQL